MVFLNKLTAIGIAELEHNSTHHMIMKSFLYSQSRGKELDSGVSMSSCATFYPCDPTSAHEHEHTNTHTLAHCSHTHIHTHVKHLTQILHTLRSFSSTALSETALSKSTPLLSFHFATVNLNRYSVT